MRPSHSSVFDPAASTPDERAVSTGVLWAIRIGFSIFLIPFLIIGFGMIFGGAFFGGFGWLGVILGLSFLAVPLMMLAAVWFIPMKNPPSNSVVPLPPAAAAGESARSCAYCGRPRAASANICDSCGAH